MTQQANALFELEMPGPEGYIIGRSDSNYPLQPDIDLAPYNARQEGVSRRHAAVVLFNDQAHAIDLDSSNGTFLNEQPLTQTEPKLLKEGDCLRLGTLELIVSYRHEP
jgi:pSer/pThr/pTyr-binding forkhead associated (FHA) protein